MLIYLSLKCWNWYWNWNRRRILLIICNLCINWNWRYVNLYKICSLILYVKLSCIICFIKIIINIIIMLFNICFIISIFWFSCKLLLFTVLGVFRVYFLFFFPFICWSWSLEVWNSGSILFFLLLILLLILLFGTFFGDFTENFLHVVKVMLKLVWV